MPSNSSLKKEVKTLQDARAKDTKELLELQAIKRKKIIFPNIGL